MAFHSKCWSSSRQRRTGPWQSVCSCFNGEHLHTLCFSSTQPAMWFVRLLCMHYKLTDWHSPVGACWNSSKPQLWAAAEVYHLSLCTSNRRLTKLRSWSWVTSHWYVLILPALRLMLASGHHFGLDKCHSWVLGLCCVWYVYVCNLQAKCSCYRPWEGKLNMVEAAGP